MSRVNYDIILVTPLEPHGAQDYFHIGLLQLATFLKNKGYKVLFFDRNAQVYGQKMTIADSDKLLLNTVCSADPLVVGFTFYTSYFKDILHCATLIKNSSPDTICIAGGVHPTFEPERTLTQIQALDLVVVGPGEQPMLSILSGTALEEIPGLAIRSGPEIFINQPATERADNCLIPDYGMVDSHFYWHSGRYMFNGLHIKSLATLVTSTPCPGKCRFCIGNKSKCQHFVQDTERILEEMDLLVNKFDVGGFWLADRDFVFDRNRAYEFAEKKQKSRMIDIPWATTSRVNQINDELARSFRKAACIAMCLGLESGSQKILDFFGKGTTVEQNIDALTLLDRNRILAMGSFILGVPTQNEEDIQANFDFFRKVRLHDSAVLMLMPVVGSAIYDELVRNGTLKPDDTETWQEISGFNAHNDPRRNYSDIPFDRFRELHNQLSVEIFETCKKNRKTLTREYRLEKYFEKS